MRELFNRAATRVSCFAGSPLAMTMTIATLLLWLALGPHFHFSDAYQLVGNTAMSVVTMLIALLIQNTQNRDSRAIHAKLDEIIRAGKSRNKLINLQHGTEVELDAIEREFEALKGEDGETD